MLVNKKVRQSSDLNIELIIFCMMESRKTVMNELYYVITPMVEYVIYRRLPSTKYIACSVSDIRVYQCAWVSHRLSVSLFVVVLYWDDVRTGQTRFGWDFVIWLLETTSHLTKS